MKLGLIHHSIILVFCSLFFVGCGNSYSSRIDEYLSILSEEARCDTSTTYTDGITLNGTASFEKRTLDVSTELVGADVKLKSMSLGNPLPTALPIRFAEVIVYDSTNHRVQCGLTDGSGNLKAVDGISSLIIPQLAGTFLIRVISRSSNNYFYVSVKQDKYRNEMHAISSNFVLTAGATNVNIDLVAHARQTDSINVEAGAFNILNTIQTAFDYAKASTVTVNTQCLAEKLNVYWKAGFNPVQYQSPEADPQTLANTSYYISDTKELFISGGQLGDLSLSNTDHFDDFAIIHELGHFIEDHCGQWVSPGGSHSLTSRIDPRLAWSEGWANYFAAHVLHARINSLDSTLTTKLADLTENATTNYGWTYFFNSYGFSDSIQNIANGEGFVIDLKRSGTDPGTYQFPPYTGQEFDKVTPVTYPGEGHTREGAISRGLFKLTNACGANCASTPLSFENVWKSFDRISGVASAENPFEGSDKVLEDLKNRVGLAWVAGAVTPATVASSEALHSKSFFPNPVIWPGYGNSLIVAGGCSLKIEPRADGALNNTSSDPRYSNHFYTIDFNLLPSSLTYIRVDFVKATGSNIDHDLILFKPGYFFNDDYTCSAYTAGTCTSFTPNRNSTNSDIFTMNRTPASTLSTNYSKTIYLTGIDQTQKYLLDIRAWTAGLSISGLTEYTYSITSNLGGLCPQ